LAPKPSQLPFVPAMTKAPAFAGASQQEERHNGCCPSPKNRVTTPESILLIYGIFV
jgi:hypothetical protein